METAPTIWDEVHSFLEEYARDYNMSFGLECSSTVDCCADFTPRRNHPQARDYPLWKGQATNRDEVIRRAMETAREGIRKHQATL